MGTLLASDIITTRIRPVLHDAAATRWSDALLLAWLNDAQRFVVQCNPKANVTNSVWQLDYGTIQTIPAGGIELIDILCNQTYSGGTYLPGTAITLIGRKDLDALRPAWRSDTADVTVQHWMFNEKDPTHFEVYPQQPTGSQGYVLGVYSYSPTDLSGIGSTITLNDIYVSPMINYVLFRAYSEETDQYALSQAVGYYNLAVTELDRKDLVMKTYDPNKARMV